MQRKRLRLGAEGKGLCKRDREENAYFENPASEFLEPRYLVAVAPKLTGSSFMNVSGAYLLLSFAFPLL